jgi:outer membrane protein assembly factor BamD
MVKVTGKARVALALAVCVVAACSSAKKDEYVERPVNELYNSGMDDLDKGEFKRAAKRFDEVERQHPYSPWATQAQLMTAYSYYKANEYDDAVLALDRFIELHPASPDVAYAYYLKGLCYYERISTVDRDQEMTEEARRTFEELTARFPNSPYSRDGKIKLDLAVDNLAGKEMNVGRYYLSRQNYLAAINRFKMVIEQYQTTTHVPEALLRLTEAYTALGLDGEARKTAAVLGYNYPETQWYADAFALVGGQTGTPAPSQSWYQFW